MNAIRQATGEGLFDDYIVLHADRLWTPRHPILAKEAGIDLREHWEEKAKKGRFLIAREKAFENAMRQFDRELKEAIHIQEDED